MPTVELIPSASTVLDLGVGPSPLRRLTKRQYENVVRDALGADVPLAESLPDDVAIGGFEGPAGARPNELLVARAQRAAQAAAAFLVSDHARLARVLGCESWTTAEERTGCLERLMAGTASRLVRRPLTVEERQRLLTRAAGWMQELDFEAAVQLTLEALLQSPAMLYRPEPGPSLDAFALASRLSFLLWDSGPDDALFDAAKNGQLVSRAQVRSQAERMVRDPKVTRGMWNFHRQWLGLERLLLDEHAQRTPDVDPAWTPQTQRAAFEESRRFVEWVMETRGTLGALLTNRTALLDAEAARLYRVSSFTPGTPVELDPAERSGILTRVAFLAATSHRGATSPPIRGSATMLRMRCTQVPPPPPGVDTSIPRPDGGARTTRQLVEARTSAPTCIACHHSLNALGFGFEHYDAAGQFRAQEAGVAVDSSFTLEGGELDGTYPSVLELGPRLAASREVQTCTTSMWVHYALGRAPVDAEQGWLDLVTQRFIASNGDVRALLVDLASSPSFLFLGEAP